jgi:serine/threonine protein kinase
MQNPSDDDDTRIRALTEEVPGYRIIRFLDGGGMGSVFLAEHKALRREVVLKRIRSDSNEPTLAQRLESEALTLAKLRHDNIVVVHTTVKDVQYIDMEYVDGGTLHDRIVKQGSLSETEAAKIALAMASALAYSHERGVIHRDFKPKNILMRKDGTPVLSDFGIAKSLAPDPTGGKTETGFVIGDLPYLARERKEGRVVAGCEDRVDVYSLGVVFYEMLMGRRPPSSEVAKSLDRFPRYRPLICACLQDDPRQRPSAADCAKQLRSEIDAISSRRRRIALTALFAALTGSVSYVAIINRPRTLDISPPQATVYLDGMRYTRTTLPDDGKAHELAVISPGYVGQLLPLGSGVTRITLEPLNTPTPEEFQSFKAHYEGRPSTEPVTLAPFKALLRLKQFEQQGLTAEFSNEWRDISNLAKLGDQSASVVEFYASKPEVGTRAYEVALNHLELAMQHGYAFATLLYMADLRNKGLADTPEYTRALKFAEQQGLERSFYTSNTK